ncbi:MAG: hypothetical protein KatS3mg115_1093 [Candidatus Poribacteria bacterium]|nr:MAG: hypothetical protein KatS3mg115_1093 [Candidatus Poribacteria bacterium]
MNRIPTFEELQQDIAEFLRKKYGVNVQVGLHGNPASAGDASRSSEEAPSERLKRVLEFRMTPKEVKAYLDRFVIGQEEAKRALSIAICDHYNFIRECHRNPSLQEAEYTKQNVLMVGPTGVGKTYLIRTLAKLVGVPFVKADATKFSETGYVGGNVEDLVRDLVYQADGDVELAQYGIIYLDEIDKIATPPNVIGRDVSGRGVQMNLLKLLEETEVDLISPYDPAGQMQAALEVQRSGKLPRRKINTRHILFIVSGAFTDLAEIVKKRVAKTRIGFGGNIERGDDAEYLRQATSEDFVRFGFEPEFIGRLPVHVYCHPLTVDHLFEILRSSEGSIVRQYEQAFRAYGIEVHFEEEGLRAIAEQAHAEQTGARGLVTVCERIFRNYKFELPSSEVREFVVDRALVEDPEGTLQRLLSDPKFRQERIGHLALQRFAEEFRRETEISLHFDEAAVRALVERATQEGITVEETARRLLRDYGHGLRLIRRNTGQDTFTITREVIESPDAVLSDWIRRSYASAQQGRLEPGTSDESV